jgi:hypothetical protein
MLSLLAKSAVYRPPENETENRLSLPDTVKRQRISINAQHCERYNKLCQWQPGIASVIHPNYVQVLSLPMQLSMMIEKPFLFKPLGLVHISNQIEVKSLCEQQSQLNLETAFGRLMWHKKGWVFEVITKAFADDRLMIEATSSYLARVKHGEATEASELIHYQDAKQQLANADLSLEPNYKLLYRSFEFSNNVGRRYASVSKDYNPIHLSAASAKLLGFRQAIAHGMYSKALCVSHSFSRIPALRQRVLGSFNVYTEFMQPIYLPSKNTLVANEANTGQQEAHASISFRLASFKNGKTRDFLRGEVSAT